ncbi:DUF3179 domain-containing (seleno)protein [Polaribacter sp. M15]
MKQIFSISIIFFIITTSCSIKNEDTPQEFTSLDIGIDDAFVNENNAVKIWCDSLAYKKDENIPDCANKNWVFVENERKMLFGGNNSNWHFDISNWYLDECNLRHGLGRETFHALINPKYYSVSDAQKDIKHSSSFSDDDRYIIVLTDTKRPKAYSIELLTKHEVINEVIDGDPIAIVFCFLADLGAVYSRVYNNKTFTFALSGYTYREPDVWGGIDGFVFWDRETESLWWPLIDKAVSGKMMGTVIKKHNTDKWFETTWGEIKSLYPEALLLKPGQTMDVPSNWPQYSCDDLLN